MKKTSKMHTMHTSTKENKILKKERKYRSKRTKPIFKSPNGNAGFKWTMNEMK